MIHIHRSTIFKNAHEPDTCSEFQILQSDYFARNWSSMRLFCRSLDGVRTDVNTEFYRSLRRGSRGRKGRAEPAPPRRLAVLMLSFIISRVTPAQLCRRLGLLLFEFLSHSHARNRELRRSSDHEICKKAWKSSEARGRNSYRLHLGIYQRRNDSFCSCEALTVGGDCDFPEDA